MLSASSSGSSHTGRPGGRSRDITQRDGFHFVHNHCCFYTWLAFYSRRSPPAIVTLSAVEVHRSDTTAPGRKGGATRVAGRGPDL